MVSARVKKVRSSISFTILSAQLSTDLGKNCGKHKKILYVVKGIRRIEPVFICAKGN